MALSTVIDPTVHLSPVTARVTDLPIERGEGSYLYTTDGRRLIDFVAGVAVHALGHCHPAVVRAVREQAGRLMHLCANYGYYPPLVQLAATLARLAPPPLDTAFFGNSGAEAIEGAIKLARHATGRPALIAFKGAFHGRTMGAGSLTASGSRYREGYEPLLGSVYHATYPYPLRSPLGPDPARVVAGALAELDSLFELVVSPKTVAAIVVEPVMGEGGYVPAPPGFLEGLRERCDRHGMLLVFDEIQTGIGRTGAMFACQRYGVTPDVLVLGKALGFGLPISAVVASRALHETWPAGKHGSTFGGNPVAAAAGLAGLAVIEAEGLVERARELGDELAARLRALADRFPIIGEVRNLGLMIGVEFVGPDGSPNTEAVQRILRYALEHGVLMVGCGTHRNVIRFMTALNIPRHVLDAGLEVFEAAVAHAEG